jgi:hypothetical protein
MQLSNVLKSQKFPLSTLLDLISEVAKPITLVLAICLWKRCLVDMVLKAVLPGFLVLMKLRQVLSQLTDIMIELLRYSCDRNKSLQYWSSKLEV